MNAESHQRELVAGHIRYNTRRLFAVACKLISSLLENTWSPFAVPNLVRAWPCFAATRLMQHALALVLVCKSAVLTTLMRNLLPQDHRMVDLTVEAHGHPVMRHCVDF